MDVVVEGFQIDEDNMEKFAAHGLSDDEVLQVLDGPHIVEQNRSGRAAPYLLIGEDYGGQCIAIPIRPTDDPEIWRPVTAWPCKPAERARLRRRARRRD
jgi:hypothetical protein